MGVAHDAFSVRSFLDDGDQRVILESDRGIDPKEPTGAVGHPNSGVLRLSYRPYSPRAVTRSPPAVGGEGDLAVADLQHPGPRAGLPRAPRRLPGGHPAGPFR